MIKVFIECSYRDKSFELAQTVRSIHATKAAIYRMLFADGVSHEEINYVRVTPVDSETITNKKTCHQKPDKN